MKRITGILLTLLVGIAAQVEAQWFYGNTAGPPSSSSAIYLNDYEAGEEPTCGDTSSGHACTLTSSTIEAITHPSGSRGVQMLGGGYSYISSSPTISESGALTLDFAFAFTFAESPGGVNVFGVSATTTFQCMMQFSATAGASFTVNSMVANGSAGSTIPISASTPYWGRLVFNPGASSDGTCDLYVWSDAYGGTEVGSVSQATGGTNATVTNVFGEWGSGQDTTWQNGEAVLCSGAVTTPADDARCDTL